MRATLPNLHGVTAVYLVASLQNSDDLAMFTAAALSMRDQGVKSITAIIPFAPTREDYAKEIDGGTKVVTLNATIHALTTAQRILLYQPHSQATTDKALSRGLSLLPLTPTGELIDAMRADGHDFDPTTSVYVCPDKGSQLMGRKANSLLNLPIIYCDKKRGDDGFGVTLANLPRRQRRLIRGRRVYMLDDMLVSGSTVWENADLLSGYGATDLTVGFVHPYLANSNNNSKGWQENLHHPLIQGRVYRTDTRVPVGDPLLDQRIRRVRMAPSIDRVIEADRAGVDFMTDPDWRSSVLLPDSYVLQPTPLAASR